MPEAERRLDNTMALIIAEKDVNHKYMKTKHQWLYTPPIPFICHFKWSPVWARTYGDCSPVFRGGFEMASAGVSLVLVAV